MAKNIEIRNSTAEFLIFMLEGKEDGIQVMYKDETIWCTQKAMAQLFDCSTDNIGLHLKNIYESGELMQDATTEYFSAVQVEGGRQVNRKLKFYNLDAIISVGYRVNSVRATQFRQWCTFVLRQFAIRGYVLDRKRMENGSFIGEDYFEHLLAEIREIRLSERRFYQKLTDIYATATDYDPRDEMTKMFFATVQNKLHYAVHENTAAEVIYNRVDNEKPFVGMTNFKGNYVTKDDVKIAKNYLTAIELQRLNLLVSGFLDFAEFQALEMNPMTMKDWIEALDNQIIAHKRKVLIDKGRISHKQAIEKAEKEFAIYRKREMDLLESDFDKEIKRLKDKNDNNPN